ncbi:X-Pro dipeptidyl-peptidase [Chondromyces apiculatus DSM 436]|uniref:X-Pro dipeptidyl-peptidase n=2 Tax=Chondromyces apiculatus TaxID=51 RepID=A0A017T6M5_9BACT|nr:X-Pro dipeptidyl-peptidase [Chondromyces apiculatus DSM 436]
MRDGARLETVILAPRGATKPLPMLLQRTPYGIPDASVNLGAHPSLAPLLADGYIFVFQNIRGRFRSEGTLVMMRPPRDGKDPRAIDETTDASDTIAWLLQNVAGHNGRVGMWGTSYDAWTATMALLDPHPALAAVIEAASPADQFLGDDFHHNGAFRLAYGFEYVAFLETEKTSNSRFPFDRGDIYDFFLDLGPLSNADRRHFHGKSPTWSDFVAHPDRDAFWERQSFVAHLRKTRVPTLNVAGFWDPENFYGPQKIYEIFEKDDAEGLNHLVLGPWNHGGWHGGTGRKLGPIDFGSDTAVHYREAIEAPFLRLHLHGGDESPGPMPEAQVFQTGVNRWRTFARWPPVEGVSKRRLYLREGRALSFESPTATGADAAEVYVSDPANPVPFYQRPIRPLLQAGQWADWLVQDQRFVDHRPDVLSFSTPPLDADVAIAGDILAELYASTSGTDSDWIVKLIDVHPEGLAPVPPKPGAPPAEVAPDLRGYQLMVASEVLRGRFRESFSRPSAIPANRVVKYTIDLHASAHVFRKGHRILVQIQSTWFPLIDRNPQRYVGSIFQATEADFIKATQRIARSREAPSALVLPVLTR